MTSNDSGEAVVTEFNLLEAQSRDFLDEIKGRSVCPQCNKSRKFYCYTCYVLVGEVKDKLRNVKLPVKVDVIKHPSEVDGKSTSPHAKVISPDDVTIYTYPCVPDYDTEKVILVFPCAESISLDQLKKSEIKTEDIRAEKLNGSTAGSVKTDTGLQPSNSERSPGQCGDVYRASKEKPQDEDLSTAGDKDWKRTVTVALKDMCSESKPKVAKLGDGSISSLFQGLGKPSDEQWRCLPSFDTVVFIDSTWLQSKKIFNDERLKGLTRVELKPRLTKFWRPQGNHPETYLATIESVYYFFRDFHKVFISDVYRGEYDNLMFFFLYTYEKVKSSRDSKKTCKR